MPTPNAQRLFVLDTNVLMHDPTALFQFQEHDVFIPMVVLEELDHAKKGMSEIARNAREVSRYIDALLAANATTPIENGIQLTHPDLPNAAHATGLLHFQVSPLQEVLPDFVQNDKADNEILRVALALQHTHTAKQITLISKDINLRIKATVLKIATQDYFEEYLPDDFDSFFNGVLALPISFWDHHQRGEPTATQADAAQQITITGPELSHWQPGLCIYDQAQALEAIVVSVNGPTANVEVTTDYRLAEHAVWGIQARNTEQNFALNLLLNPNLDFVSLAGTAGTGKTLLTLAAGLLQTLEQGRFQEIIITRVTIPVGEDIGYLPGTEEEKMAPWMGALMDNLEVLNSVDQKDAWSRGATHDFLSNKIKISSLNYMRGRTFLNKFVIIDEAQNLTAKQLKTLITRAGPGTKIVCLGNIEQIDTPYLTQTTSGLSYIAERFRTWEHSAHITLARGERSRLADFAQNNL